MQPNIATCFPATYSSRRKPFLGGEGQGQVTAGAAGCPLKRKETISSMVVATLLVFQILAVCVSVRERDTDRQTVRERRER